MVGNGSRLAFMCRASDFQKRIADVKQEMAVLFFCCGNLNLLQY